MFRPLGTGRRCAASTTSGCAAATAASKISRNSGRRSVIGPRSGSNASAGYPFSQNINKPPRALPAGASRIVGRMSAGDVRGDHVAEQLPALTLEAHQLKLADRREIGRRGIDGDARQQHLGAEITQARRLLHVVLTREIVAALLEHLLQGLRHAISDLGAIIELVAFGEILG